MKSVSNNFLAAQPSEQLDFNRVEPSFYHMDAETQPRVGYFSLLFYRPQADRKRQRSYPLTMLPTVLDKLDPTIDTWISQAEFWRPNRRLVNLSRVGLLFIDLDTYRVRGLHRRSADELTRLALLFCSEEGLPAPSVILYSGRGLQIKWLLECAVPAQALLRWNACQRQLVERLAPLGADPGARDASRVLRVEHTINSKSGELCVTTHVAGSPSAPLRYNFEYLCEELLPVSRDHLEQARKTRTTNRQKKKRSGLALTPNRLAWDRLHDLRTLAQLRGGYQEGERMRHLHWQLNFMLLSGATHSGQMWYEAGEIARQIDPRWGYGNSELSTLYAKAKQMQVGEWVEFQGRRYPPLYTPRNDTLINLFEITDEEQRQLKTIVSKDISRERDRDWHERKRRAEGRTVRAKYESNAKQSRDARRELILKLKKQGLKQTEIASKLKISKSLVSLVLRGVR